MKRWWIVAGSLLAILAGILVVGLALAQEPEPLGNAGPAGGGVDAGIPMGTAFTYQGQLKRNGNPVNDTCYFWFTLWDEETGGTPIGHLERSVPVNNGLFTVPLDFGEGAFNGNARWLEISVKCTGDPGYVALSPRQKLTPAPYALALPGLRTQQNITSTNLIGGYAYNWVAIGVVGATIGGGGAMDIPNRVTDNYGTVGGGLNNQAGDNAGSITDRLYATVGGGRNNIAGGAGSFVGGGGYDGTSETGNRAYGAASVIGGGLGNVIPSTSTYATVGGGYSNTANGTAATIGGGYRNETRALGTTIGGGYFNQATNSYASVGGGLENRAEGMYATIPGGYRALASHFGEMAYASGIFSALGDAQTSIYVLRNTTSGTTLTELFLDGTDDRLTVASGRTVAFDILVVGRSNGGESAGYRIYGVVENVGGTTAMVGSAVETVLAEDDSSWDVAVDADDSTNALRIRVQGGLGDSVRWVATVRTVEVSW